MALRRCSLAGQSASQPVQGLPARHLAVSRHSARPASPRLARPEASVPPAAPSPCTPCARLIPSDPLTIWHSGPIPRILYFPPRTVIWALGHLCAFLRRSALSSSRTLAPAYWESQSKTQTDRAARAAPFAIGHLLLPFLPVCSAGATLLHHPITGHQPSTHLPDASASASLQSAKRRPASGDRRHTTLPCGPPAILA